MIRFIYIIALLYILFYDLKLMRYAEQSARKIIRNMISSSTLLIASLYLRTGSLGPRSSIYIQLSYAISPLITVAALFLLLRFTSKYRKELLRTIREFARNKWNIFETAVLTALLIAVATDSSLWSFMATFAVVGVLIAKEAFTVALNKQK